MWPFKRKRKIVKEVNNRIWGFLVQQGFDVDTLTNDVRCVEKAGDIDGGVPVIHFRYFKLSDAAKRNVEVAGWETFDQHPDLVLFEGYLNERSNQIHVERKSA